MRKVYKKLTSDQIARGIIFSSNLIGGGKVHEVHKDDKEKDQTIARLLNDSFFNSSPYKYNEIRK